ncbi:uncharacterized protein LOC125751322 [Brienomyrus brachyistius]|uniref:uncharacterized protein LOC125751322 n=1 Tax=Brienomyrus brachyistius TaxID=42636 RepID=UPI0020B3DBCD|nr:uncharacterized protein LOC125751322 [Brienomyrus brachyistius]
MRRGQTAKSGRWSYSVPEMAHCTPSHVKRNRHRAPALSQWHLTGLSQDSGVNLSEPNQVSGSNETVHVVCRSASYDLDNAGEDGYCTSGFSEEHLLNITFEACDTLGKGEVLATTLMRYLQEMTAQSPGQDRLAILYDMLDPERKDLSVRKDTFHSVMRMWISRCCQDGFQEGDYQTVGAERCQVPIDGIEFSPFETEKQYPEGGDGCHCESRDLLSVLEELKHTQKKLNEQNSSLLGTVSQCEDTNLQLIVEVTELRTKLASAQRAALRSKSLCDELEEARRVTRESQDKAAKTQAGNCKLIKENEYLKAHIKIIEELNEKLVHEKTNSEGRISKLVKINAEIREELDEILVTLAEKDKEISKKSVFIDDLKISYQQNCKIIEDMQLELLQLQENTQLDLLRFGRSSGRGRPALHQRSLQSEIEETQKRANLEVCGSVCGIVSPYNQRDRVQILQEMSSEEFVDFLAAKPSGSDAALSNAFEILERAYIKCYQQQTAIRKDLANVEQELEQQKALKEETERKLTEQEQQLRKTQKLVLEAKEMVAVNCWRASKLEDDKARVMEEVIQDDQTQTEVVKRLRQIESTVQELQDQVCHLEVGQRITQQQVSKFTNSKGWKPAVCEANSEDPIKETCHKQDENRQQKDVAIATDPVEETIALVTKQDITFDPATEIHVSQKGTETILSQAFEGTELDQAKMRMDTATQRIEEELLVTADAQMHWNLIEACTSIKKEQSVAPICTSDVTETGTVSSVSSRSVQVIRLDSKTAPFQPVNEGRSSWSQDSEDSGIVCSADKSSQLEYSCFPVGAWHGNDCAGSSSLAKTSSADPEETLSDSVPPLSESGDPQFTPQSQGPDPETCPLPVPECDTKEHVGRQETTGNSYSVQSEAADDEIRQTLLIRFPALVVSDKAEASRSSRCPSLPEPDAPPSGTSSTPRLHPRTRLSLPPAMPTLPEEEEDSPEELDSSSSSPTSCPPLESRGVTMILQPPSIIFPVQANTGSQDPRPLEVARPQSPRPRLPRNFSSLGNPITTVDSMGHVIDLVKDQLPNVQLSEEEMRKNLELLEEAKKVSDRFLMRRGRRSTCSLSDSPTGLSPCPTPRSSPVPSRSSSLTAPPQIETSEMSYAICQATQNLEVPGVREHGDSIRQDLENSRKFLDWKPTEKRKVSSGTLCPRYATALSKDDCDPGAEAGRKASLSAAMVERTGGGALGRGSFENGPPATGVAKPFLRPTTLQTPCTAEIKTMGVFPPLMRAMSWDAVGSNSSRTDLPGLAPKGEEAYFGFEQPADSLLKSSRYKDFPKLSKMREEHMLMRTQTIGGYKLPDLNETAEQDRASSTEEEPKEKSDVMPNISDMMLRKLKLHRTLLSGTPSLTEKEVENAFVQLSLAFRNDSYTLEMRLKHAEKDRNLTEDNTDKELEEFKCCLKGSITLWQNSEQREAFQRLLETVAVLQSLATRLSSRAEMVGAVRQEKRMNKATEVMMQYVENLKRTYEKDHAELMEFKKLANQNSNRCYSGSVDTGDDGVPRTSRSLSLTLGKPLPRRRVSVAVVPKFNLLNIPGQNPPSPGLPALCEANSGKGSSPTDFAQHSETESGKTEQESDLTTLLKPAVSSSTDEISSEIKAKIEEDAYNKGYQEGLKRSKELQVMRELEEKKVKEEIQEQKEEKEWEVPQEKECKSRKHEQALEILDWLFPKISKRNRKIWIFLVLFGIVFFMVNIFRYFSNRYNEVGNPTTGKTVSPGQNSLSGM